MPQVLYSARIISEEEVTYALKSYGIGGAFSPLLTDRAEGTLARVYAVEVCECSGSRETTDKRILRVRGRIAVQKDDWVHYVGTFHLDTGELSIVY
ncbi:MAG: hypothetical protein WCT24_01345 [Patescibacteria group bacterium]|jgi:hypothetical protein